MIIVEEGTSLVLCGNSYFTLILQATKWHPSSNNDPEVFTGLMEIIDPAFGKLHKGNSFNTTVSQYRNCSEKLPKKSVFLPYTDPVTMNTFKKLVLDNPKIPLAAMQSFTNKFIDTDPNSKKEWLVKALLELIWLDNSIDGEEEFKVQLKGQPVKKSELDLYSDKTSTLHINLPMLLLDVWCFILIDRPDNAIGRVTFNSWHKEADTKGQKRNFKSDIGTEVKQKIEFIEIDEVAENNSCLSAKDTGVSVDTPASVVDLLKYVEEPEQNKITNTPLDNGKYEAAATLERSEGFAECEAISYDAPESSQSATSLEEIYIKFITNSIKYKFREFIESEPLKEFTASTDAEVFMLEISYSDYEKSIKNALMQFNVGNDYIYEVQEEYFAYSGKQLTVSLLSMNESFADFIYLEILPWFNHGKEEPIYGEIYEFREKLTDYIKFLREHLKPDGDYFALKDNYVEENDPAEEDDCIKESDKFYKNMGFHSDTRGYRAKIESLYKNIRNTR